MFEEPLNSGTLVRGNLTYLPVVPGRIEFARRVLPHDVRPSFNETEKFCRAAAGGGAKQEAQAQAQAA